jgi:FlaA1/EpsC-like NDP-sugar epimerase
MDIRGKTVLVLGGWGLVGLAVCRKIMEEQPRRVIVTSLLREEALEAVETLRKEFPATARTFFVPWWGNIFVREQLRTCPATASSPPPGTVRCYTRTSSMNSPPRC